MTYFFITKDPELYLFEPGTGGGAEAVVSEVALRDSAHWLTE